MTQTEKHIRQKYGSIGFETPDNSAYRKVKKCFN